MYGAKIMLGMRSFAGEVKPSVHVADLRHVKDPYD
jgi:hypothetical protein